MYRRHEYSKREDLNTKGAKDQHGHKGFHISKNLVSLVSDLRDLRVKKTNRSMQIDNSSAEERGQSLVELGVSLTFLFILLAGVVDIGRAFFTYITLRDAAQEGALYASFEEIKCQDTEARVKTTTQEVGDLIDANAVQFSCQVIGPACGDKDSANSGAVQVTLTYEEFPLTMPFLGTLLGSQTIEISTSSTDNILTPLCSSSLP